MTEPSSPGGMAAPEVHALADRFFGAVERGDLEELGRLYHPEARIWHNHDQSDQTVEENLRTLRWMLARLFDRTYEVIRREVLVDGFVQQHVLRGLTRQGEPFAMPACMIVRCRDGKVERVEEYLDPAQAAPLHA